MAYKIDVDEALCFDDVLMPPRYSDVIHRGDVDLSVDFAGTQLSTPLISANMDTVTGEDMWRAMRKYGGFAYIHRFMTSEARLAHASIMLESGEHPAMSIGVSSKEFEIAQEMITRGVNHICIDIAHGDHVSMYQMLAKLRDRYTPDELTICAGNVCTTNATAALRDAGADIVKIGIGPGAVCSTRVVTGCGYPQLSAIDQCSRVDDVLIIADGGMRDSGDIAKALAAGADAIMSGFIFAGCTECLGKTYRMGTESAKEYRGMASFKAQTARLDKEITYPSRTPEGISRTVPCKGPVSQVVRGLNEGLQCACSYQGAHNLEQLRENATFVKVTANSIAESRPRV